MSSDALVKITDCVNKAIVSGTKDLKDSVVSEVNKLEAKSDLHHAELMLKIASMELEMAHIKERLEHINTIFSAGDGETKLAATAKKSTGKKKAVKADTDGSEKVKTITEFCSWKWVNDPDFRAKHATDDNMEKINSVATVKNAKDDATRLKNEGRAFYSKIVNAKGASANPALLEEMKKAFEDFKKPFDDLKVDDRDSALGDL
jgi:hypothetical protein